MADVKAAVVVESKEEKEEKVEETPQTEVLAEEEETKEEVIDDGFAAGDKDACVICQQENNVYSKSMKKRKPRGQRTCQTCVESGTNVEAKGSYVSTAEWKKRNLTKGKPLVVPKYDPLQAPLPKCFACGARHDFGECSKDGKKK